MLALAGLRIFVQYFSMKKICIKCGKEYELEFFIPNKQCKNGRTNTCRNCHNEKSRKYSKENYEKVKASKDKYVINNKEKIEIRRKEIRDNDPERFKLYRKKMKEKGTIKPYDPEYYQKNKTKWIERTEKYRLSNPDKYKVHAKNNRTKNHDSMIERTKVWRKNNPEKQYICSNRWRLNNLDTINEKKRNDIKELKDYYMVMRLKKLGFSKDNIKENPELINLEREIIKIKRLCKTSKNLETN